MCPCLKAGWKVGLLVLAPVATVAVLAAQFVAPTATPTAPSGVLLSDLREPAGHAAVPANAQSAGEQLIVDMNHWTETAGSGNRR
jgi:hypothetical protein